MEDNHSKNSVSGDSTDLTIVKGEKTGIPKWLMVTVIAMAAVIVGLTVTLIAVIAGKSSGETSQDLPSSQSSQGAQIYSDSAGNGGSSVTEIPESQTGTSQPQVTENGVVLQYSVDNSWGEAGSMFYGLQLGITNNTGDNISGWELVIDVDGLLGCDGWNGTYSRSGDTLAITSMEYNGDIPVGSTVAIGCNINTENEFKISRAILNEMECTVKQGAVVQNNVSAGGGNQSAAADVETLLKRSEQAEQGDDWLHTDGNKILDKDGKQVWLTGVNWFGYNTGTNTFDGLWNSELKTSVKAIADHGFNLIRVPISAELINKWSAGE